MDELPKVNDAFGAAGSGLTRMYFLSISALYTAGCYTSSAASLIKRGND